MLVGPFEVQDWGLVGMAYWCDVMSKRAEVKSVLFDETVVAGKGVFCFHLFSSVFICFHLFSSLRPTLPPYKNQGKVPYVYSRESRDTAARFIPCAKSSYAVY